MGRSKKYIKVAVEDIVSVSACSDLTLPPGAGLCIETIHGPLFLVSTYSFDACCSGVKFTCRACLAQLQLLNITPEVESGVELWSCLNPAPQL